MTILDNRDICSHAGFCTDGLPTVFFMDREPWIDPDGDTVERIIERVRACPSGALSYAVDGVERRHPPDRPAAVKVNAAGAYHMTGGSRLEGAVWAEGASQEPYAQCRCGGSRRKPFCDGPTGGLEGRRVHAPADTGGGTAAGHRGRAVRRVHPGTR